MLFLLSTNRIVAAKNLKQNRLQNTSSLDGSSNHGLTLVLSATNMNLINGLFMIVVCRVNR